LPCRGPLPATRPGGGRGRHQDPPEVVWPPEPCAEEIPEPPENPEFADPEEPELAEELEPSSEEEPKPSSDPEELDEPDEVPEPLDAAVLPEEPVVLACDDPGSV